MTDELQQLLKTEKAANVELNQWVKMLAGNCAERDRQFVQQRICHHQELTIQVGEQLRSFLLSFPSSETFSAKLHHPFSRPNRLGCGIMWSEEEFCSLKEGLLSALQCVTQVHASSESKWQVQYDQLNELVETKTRDLHRLDEKVKSLQHAAQQVTTHTPNCCRR